MVSMQRGTDVGNDTGTGATGASATSLVTPSAGSLMTLVIIPHHLTAAPGDLQAAVQQRVLDILAQQIMLSGTASSTDMDLRHLGLETLHQVPQASGPTHPTELVGRGTILKVPDSVCRPAPPDPALYLVPPESSTSRGRPPPFGYLQEKGHSALIEIAFQ